MDNRKWLDHRPNFNLEKEEWSSDSLALNEEKTWGGEIRKINHENNKRLIYFYGYGVLILSGFLLLCFISYLIVWVWHMLAPETCQWLTTQQLERVHSILLSGGAGAIVSDLIKKNLQRV